MEVRRARSATRTTRWQNFHNAPQMQGGRRGAAGAPTVRPPLHRQQLISDMMMMEARRLCDASHSPGAAGQNPGRRAVGPARAHPRSGTPAARHPLTAAAAAPRRRASAAPLAPPPGLPHPAPRHRRGLTLLLPCHLAKQRLRRPSAAKATTASTGARFWVRTASGHSRHPHNQSRLQPAAAHSWPASMVRVRAPGTMRRRSAPRGTARRAAAAAAARAGRARAAAPRRPRLRRCRPGRPAAAATAMAPRSRRAPWQQCRDQTRCCGPGKAAGRSAPCTRHIRP